MLVEGKCTLIYAEEKGEDLEFHAVKMEKGKLYVIPQSLWHNTITVKDTKMFLIEDVSTGNDNSDVRELTPEQIKTVQELAK